MIGKRRNKQEQANKRSNRADIAPVGEQRLARVERLDDDVLEGVVGGVVMKILRPPANNFR